MGDIIFNLERTDFLSNGVAPLSLLKQARPLIAQRLIKPELNVDFNRLFEKRVVIDFQNHSFRNEFGQRVDEEWTQKTEKEFLQSCSGIPKEDSIQFDIGNVKEFCESYDECNPIYFDDDYAQLVGLKKALVPFHMIIDILVTEYEPIRMIDIIQLQRLYVGDLVTIKWFSEGNTRRCLVLNSIGKIAYVAVVE